MRVVVIPHRLWSSDDWSGGGFDAGGSSSDW